jgi:hypothetical protein
VNGYSSFLYQTLEGKTFIASAISAKEENLKKIGAID